MHSQRERDPKPRSPRATAQPHDKTHRRQPDRAANQRPSTGAQGGLSKVEGRETDEVMCVRLTRKYADLMDGVDLSSAHVGDRIDLPRHDAEVLIAEGWAERVHRAPRRSSDVRSVAADKPRRRKPAPKHKKR